PDDGVGVHEPGGRDLRGQDAVPVGDPDLGSRADALDLAIAADEDHAVVDGGARHGVEGLRAHRDLGGGARRYRRECECDGDARGRERAYRSHRHGGERSTPDHSCPSMSWWWKLTVGRETLCPPTA